MNMKSMWHGLSDDIRTNSVHALEREELILKEIKRREHKRTTARSSKKPRRQIRGHDVKPSSLEKNSITRLGVQDAAGIWKQIHRKESIEEHIAQRNVEQVSHTGKTPLDILHWGRNLVTQVTLPWQKRSSQGPSSTTATSPGNTTNYQDHRHGRGFQVGMQLLTREDIIVLPGKRLPPIQKHAQKVQAMDWQMQQQVYIALSYVMLENIPGVVQSNKLRIIQLLEVDLNQVIRIAFARNITRLEKTHDGVISKHQYGRSHKT
jgi:hypothetical protein